MHHALISRSLSWQLNCHVVGYSIQTIDPSPVGTVKFAATVFEYNVYACTNVSCNTA